MRKNDNNLYFHPYKHENSVFLILFWYSFIVIMFKMMRYYSRKNLYFREMREYLQLLYVVVTYMAKCLFVINIIN